jgi:hypothetical protein
MDYFVACRIVASVRCTGSSREPYYKYQGIVVRECNFDPKLSFEKRIDVLCKHRKVHRYLRTLAELVPISLLPMLRVK